MRTTVTIDDDLYEAARALAAARGASIGAILTELARKGLHAERHRPSESGFPVFRVSEDATPITPEQVHRFEDLP